MELRTVITKCTYCKVSLLLYFVFLTIIGSGSTYKASDLIFFKSDLYNKAHNEYQHNVAQSSSTNINNRYESSNKHMKRQLGSHTGTRNVHWAPVAFNPEKINSKEEPIERERIWGSQPLDKPRTASLTNSEGGENVNITLRSNFYTNPRPRDRNVFRTRG